MMRSLGKAPRLHRNAAGLHSAPRLRRSGEWGEGAGITARKENFGAHLRSDDPSGGSLKEARMGGKRGSLNDGAQ